MFSMTEQVWELGFLLSFLYFFFQAEDGIRDYKVTGVQTCALPISHGVLDDAAHGPDLRPGPAGAREGDDVEGAGVLEQVAEIGRASCRERGERAEGAEGVKRTENERAEGAVDGR